MVFTKKQIEKAARLANEDQKRTYNNAISNVCDECGIEANRLTCLKKYGKEPDQKKFLISTYHIGKCDCCEKKKFVTEARDFFYPDFSLLLNKK